ncbi:MAG: hypothetical protein AB8B55_05545 [Mariniblastus sp.]
MQVIEDGNKALHFFDDSFSIIDRSLPRASMRNLSVVITLVVLSANVCSAAEFNNPTLASSTTTSSPSTETQQTSNQPEAQQNEQSVDDLIRQLGDNDYDVRVQAETQLLAIGRKAIGPLRLAITQRQTVAPDNEIRLRSTRILILIERAEAKRKIRSFLDGGPEVLPGWEKFSQITGENKASRKLFANIYKSHPDLFDAISEGKQETEEAIQTLAKTSLRWRSNANKTLTAGAAIMFASTLKFENESMNKVDPNKQTEAFETPSVSLADLTRLRTVLINQQMVGFLKSSGNKPLLDRLASTWLDTIPNSDAASANIKLSVILSLRLNDKTELAMTFASDRNRNARTRVEAIAVIWQTATEKHIPGLEKLFDDSTLVGNFVLRPKNQNGAADPETETSPTDPTPQLLNVQIRDLALATAVKLSQFDAEEIGLRPRSLNKDEKLNPNLSGFIDEESRRVAFLNWNRKKISQ